MIHFRRAELGFGARRGSRQLSAQPGYRLVWEVVANTGRSSQECEVDREAMGVVRCRGAASLGTAAGCCRAGRGPLLLMGGRAMSQHDVRWERCLPQGRAAGAPQKPRTSSGRVRGEEQHAPGLAELVESFGRGADGRGEVLPRSSSLLCSLETWRVRVARGVQWWWGYGRPRSDQGAPGG